jgi:predicted ArsR family transcriptional regulator
MQINEIWADSGEEVLRDATPEEVEALEAIYAEEEARKAELEAKAEAKAALLERLGITAEEAKLLA